MTFDPVADYQKTILAKIGVRISPTDTVLDLGCGRGDSAVIFARKAKRVVGVDIEPWKVWRKTKRNNLSFKCADATELPFENGIFDVVFTKDTLHHIQDVDKALREIKRVTKKNGLIYVVEANRYNPIFYIHMTKMLGHEHFTGKKFKNYILRVFSTVKFLRCESRVYPITNSRFHMMIHYFEKILEIIPGINKLLTYNIATIVNN